MAQTDQRATAQVVRDATTNLQGLVRAEVDLAKAELQEGMQKALVGVAMLLVTAVLGLFVLAFLGVTAAKALEEVMVPWAAWLVTTGGVLVVAGIIAAVGLRQLKKAELSPKKTTESIQETVAWARTQIRR